MPDFKEIFEVAHLGLVEKFNHTAYGMQDVINWEMNWVTPHRGFKLRNTGVEARKA